MIRIGDFSKLSRASVNALRFYDEMGMHKPVENNPSIVNEIQFPVGK